MTADTLCVTSHPFSFLIPTGTPCRSLLGRNAYNCRERSQHTPYGRHVIECALLWPKGVSCINITTIAASSCARNAVSIGFARENERGGREEAGAGTSLELLWLAPSAKQEPPVTAAY
jgi:hypothetical protein